MISTAHLVITSSLTFNVIHTALLQTITVQQLQQKVEEIMEAESSTVL